MLFYESYLLIFTGFSIEQDLCHSARRMHPHPRTRRQSDLIVLPQFPALSQTDNFGNILRMIFPFARVADSA